MIVKNSLVNPTFPVFFGGGSEGVRAVIAVNKGSICKFEVMKEDYIKLCFSLSEPIAFKYGDYIDLTQAEEEGYQIDQIGHTLPMLRTRYELSADYAPKYNQSTGGYDYELQFDADYYKWRNKTFRLVVNMQKTNPDGTLVFQVDGSPVVIPTRRDSSFSYTGTAEDHLDLILANLSALGYKYNGLDYQYSIIPRGTDVDGKEVEYVKNVAKNISYNSTSILDALFSIANTYECECWIEGNIIYFGKREVEVAGEIPFLREGYEATEITTNKGQGNYATRIYAYGSKKNITETYRKDLRFNTADIDPDKFYIGTEKNHRNITDGTRIMKSEYYPTEDVCEELPLEKGSFSNQNTFERFYDPRTIIPKSAHPDRMRLEDSFTFEFDTEIDKAQKIVFTTKPILNITAYSLSEEYGYSDGMMVYVNGQLVYGQTWATAENQSGAWKIIGGYLVQVFSESIDISAYIDKHNVVEIKFNGDRVMYKKKHARLGTFSIEGKGMQTKDATLPNPLMKFYEERITNFEVSYNDCFGIPLESSWSYYTEVFENEDEQRLYAFRPCASVKLFSNPVKSECRFIFSVSVCDRSGEVVTGSTASVSTTDITELWEKEFSLPYVLAPKEYKFRYELKCVDLEGNDYPFFVEGIKVFMESKCAYPEIRTVVKVLNGALAGKLFKARLNPRHGVEIANNMQMYLDEGTFEGKTYYTHINETIQRYGGLYYYDIYAVPSRCPIAYFSDNTNIVRGTADRRLLLPNEPMEIDGYQYNGEGYVDAYETMTDAEVVEGTIVTEDIFPHLVMGMKNITTRSGKQTYTDTNTGELVEEEIKAYQFDAYFARKKEDGTYELTDERVPFSDDYIIKEGKLMITFENNLLAGMSFEVAFDPNEGITEDEKQRFEIIINDQYGLRLPNDTLMPKEGDMFVMYGYNAEFFDKTLVPEAEKRLLEFAVEYARKSKREGTTYSVTLAPEWIEERQENNKNPENPYKEVFFGYGALLEIEDNTLRTETKRKVRVRGWQIPLDFANDHPQYILGETSKYSRIGALERTVNGGTVASTSLSRNGGGGSIYLIRLNDSTPPSDTNVYSALRSDTRYLSKEKDETTNYSLTMRDAHINRDARVGGVLNVGNEAFVGGLDVRESTNLHGEVTFDSLTRGVQGSGVWRDEMGNAHMEADYLHVHRKLEASEVQIQETTFVGGKQIYSAANGFVISQVEIKDDFYRLYFDITSDNKVITSTWRKGDLAYYQDFNLKSIELPIRYTEVESMVVIGDIHEMKVTRAYGKEGDVMKAYEYHYKVSNNKLVVDYITDEEGNRVQSLPETYLKGVASTFWWREVLSVGEDYIDVSVSSCALGSDIPKEGDRCAMLGHNAQKDEAQDVTETRQAAIMICACDDTGLVPYIQFYKGIKDFSLPKSPNVQISPKSTIINAEEINLVSAAETTSFQNVVKDLKSMGVDIKGVTDSLGKINSTITEQGTLIEGIKTDTDKSLKEFGSILDIERGHINLLNYFFDFTKEGEGMIKTGGLVTTNSYASIFAQEQQSGRIDAATKAEVSAEVSAGISSVKISGDQIDLEGYTTINGGFRIDEEGNIAAKSAYFEGLIKNGYCVICAGTLDKYTYIGRDGRRYIDFERTGQNILILGFDKGGYGYNTRGYAPDWAWEKVSGEWKLKDEYSSESLWLDNGCLRLFLDLPYMCEYSRVIEKDEPWAGRDPKNMGKYYMQTNSPYAQELELTVPYRHSSEKNRLLALIGSVTPSFYSQSYLAYQRLSSGNPQDTNQYTNGLEDKWHRYGFFENGVFYTDPSLHDFVGENKADIPHLTTEYTHYDPTKEPRTVSMIEHEIARLTEKEKKAVEMIGQNLNIVIMASKVSVGFKGSNILGNNHLIVGSPFSEDYRGNWYFTDVVSFGFPLEISLQCKRLEYTFRDNYLMRKKYGWSFAYKDNPDKPFYNYSDSTENTDMPYCASQVIWETKISQPLPPYGTGLQIHVPIDNRERTLGIFKRIWAYHGVAVGGIQAGGEVHNLFSDSQDIHFDPQMMGIVNSMLCVNDKFSIKEEWQDISRNFNILKNKLVSMGYEFDDWYKCTGTYESADDEGNIITEEKWERVNEDWDDLLIPTVIVGAVNDTPWRGANDRGDNSKRFAAVALDNYPKQRYGWYGGCEPDLDEINKIDYFFPRYHFGQYSMDNYTEYSRLIVPAYELVGKWHSLDFNVRYKGVDSIHKRLTIGTNEMWAAQSVNKNTEDVWNNEIDVERLCGKHIEGNIYSLGVLNTETFDSSVIKGKKSIDNFIIQYISSWVKAYRKLKYIMDEMPFGSVLNTPLKGFTKVENYDTAFYEWKKSYFPSLEMSEMTKFGGALVGKANIAEEQRGILSNMKVGTPLTNVSLTLPYVRQEFFDKSKFYGSYNLDAFNLYVAFKEYYEYTDKLNSLINEIS